MTRVLCLFLSVTLLAACNAGRDGGGQNATSANRGSQTANASNDGNRDRKTATVGDAVVARFMPGKYYEGKVRNIKGTRAEIAWADNSAANDVELSDVYIIPSEDARAKVRTGDMVLARWPEVVNNLARWVLAEVTGVSEDYVNVRYLSDNSNSNPTHNQVIALSAEDAVRLKAEFQNNK